MVTMLVLKAHQHFGRNVSFLNTFILLKMVQNNTVYLHAYAIPLLHAAKYPSSDVCGVLLGKNTADGLKVETAIPFFHHWTAVTPMLEVALKQVQ
jgi:hypothetical protein